MFTRPIAGLFGLLAIGGLVATTSIVRAISPQTPTALPPEDLPSGKPSAYYAAITNDALAVGNIDLAAEAAALGVAQPDPASDDWHRLVAVELVRAQQALQPLSADGVLALASAYEAAPYVAPKVMIWRVEVAHAHWPSMPAVLEEQTLSQLRVLGRLGETWAVRERWCQTFTVRTLKDAACATLEGEVPE